jgi:hypothetical protein
LSTRKVSNGIPTKDDSVIGSGIWDVFGRRFVDLLLGVQDSAVRIPEGGRTTERLNSGGEGTWTDEKGQRFLLLWQLEHGPMYYTNQTHNSMRQRSDERTVHLGVGRGAPLHCRASNRIHRIDKICGKDREFQKESRRLREPSRSTIFRWRCYREQNRQ